MNMMIENTVSITESAPPDPVIRLTIDAIRRIPIIMNINPVL